MSHPFPRRRVDRLRVQEVSDEILVYDLIRHRAHRLTRFTNAVWAQCDGHTSPIDIGRRLGDGDVESLVLTAIQQLGAADLLARTDSRVEPVDYSKRALLKVGAAAGVPFVMSIAVPTPAAAQSAPSTTPPSVPGTALTIGFDGLTGNGSPFTSVSQSGFTVSPTLGSWVIRTDYGRPAPFIQFFAPLNVPVLASIQITRSGGLFTFSSVDVYSSVTAIPYQFMGSRNNITVFTVVGTQPMTQGLFATASNTYASSLIDSLSIFLFNDFKNILCGVTPCANPMGLDNISLTF